MKRRERVLTVHLLDLDGDLSAHMTQAKAIEHYRRHWIANLCIPEERLQKAKLDPHTRRHMEQDTPENRRRIDPVLAIHEIEAAGFEFADYSDLHYRADDELRYEVGRSTVTGNTDRWTLKFIKP